MCRNLICPEILWMGSSCLVTALSISRLERKLHAGLLLLQAGGFLCNPHYDWKVNSSAAGQSILGRLSVGEAASGRGERNECEASHPVTAPSFPLLPPTSVSQGAPPGSCGSCWGWRGLAVELHMRRQPGRSFLLSSSFVFCHCTGIITVSLCRIISYPRW